MTPGYVDEAANQGVLLPDGWFNSGDLGRIDPDGFLWITGRAKDVIIRGGHNIDPTVIEETLLKHPDVVLAAAVSKPDSTRASCRLPMCSWCRTPGPPPTRCRPSPRRTARSARLRRRKSS